MPVLKIKNADGTWSEIGSSKNKNAMTTDGGFAAGAETNATGGAAVGRGASTNIGGAVGQYATSQSGFSGGYNAKSSVDAIQLGSGTNTETKSLQIYDKQLMNGSGYIPVSRLICHSETITSTLESGTTNYTHDIAKTWTGGIPIVRSVNWVNGSSTYAAANIMFSVAEDDFNNFLRIRVQRPTGMSASTDVSYCLQIDILGV